MPKTTALEQLAGLTDVIESLTSPLLKTKSITSQIDGLVILTVIKNTISKRVELLEKALHAIIPVPAEGQTLICNGQHEHLEIKSIQQSMIPPDELAKILSLHEFCQCVKVSLDAAEEQLGKEEAEAIKQRSWTSQWRKHRGRHPNPHYVVSGGKLVKKGKRAA